MKDITFLRNFIKNFFKNTFSGCSNSALFWNAMIYVIFIISLCINYGVALSIFSGLGSILLLGAIFDGLENEKVLWAPITFSFWIIVIFILFFMLGEFIFKHTIAPFNKWLDK